MSPPTIEQIIEALMYQVIVGKAHLKVAAGLANSDPVLLAMAKTFFAMTLDAHHYSALMYAARVHDTQRNAVTVETLLRRAEEEKHRAKKPVSEVDEAIQDARKQLSEIADLLDELEKRRNRRLAHTDPRTLNDPNLAVAATKEDYENLEKLFKKTGDIVNEFSRLFRDITGILEILGESDYKSVLDLLYNEKCRQVMQYETEFGAPAPFQRPRDYR